MGGCPSTRKVTIENKDGLQVSEDVIKRLTEGPPAKSKGKPDEFDLPENEELMKEVNKTNDYWRSRIAKEKAHQSSTDERMKEELKKTLDRYDLPFLKPPVKPKGSDSKKKPPDESVALKADLIKCYKENPKRSLNCAAHVENFNKWFESKRQERKA